MSPNMIILLTRLSGLLPDASLPLWSRAGVSRSRGWPLDLEPLPLQKRHMIVRCVLFRCLFEMIVFEVLGALYWDRHPFHAPGVCSDVREIRWNMKSTTAAHTHTHTHTHTLPHRCVTALLLGSSLGILWLQTGITWAEVLAAATPPLPPLLFFPFLSARYERSGGEGFTTPPSHLPSSLVGWEEWRWLMWSGGSGGVEPGSSSALAQSRALRGHTKAGIDPGRARWWNLPPPTILIRVWGRWGQGRKGLKEETFLEAVCSLYVATKLSFFSRGTFGYSAIRTYSRHASAVVSVKRTEVEKNFTSRLIHFFPPHNSSLKSRMPQTPFLFSQPASNYISQCIRRRSAVGGDASLYFHVNKQY